MNLSDEEHNEAGGLAAEEEYDDANDVTFGAGAEIADWELAHEEYVVSSLFEHCNLSTANQNASSPSPLPTCKVSSSSSSSSNSACLPLPPLSSLPSNSLSQQSRHHQQQQQQVQLQNRFVGGDVIPPASSSATQASSAAAAIVTSLPLRTVCAENSEESHYEALPIVAPPPPTHTHSQQQQLHSSLFSSAAAAAVASSSGTTTSAAVAIASSSSAASASVSLQLKLAELDSFISYLSSDLEKVVARKLQQEQQKRQQQHPHPYPHRTHHMTSSLAAAAAVGVGGVGEHDEEEPQITDHVLIELCRQQLGMIEQKALHLQVPLETLRARVPYLTSLMQQLRTHHPPHSSQPHHSQYTQHAHHSPANQYGHTHAQHAQHAHTHASSMAAANQQQRGWMTKSEMDFVVRAHLKSLHACSVPPASSDTHANGGAPPPPTDASSSAGGVGGNVALDPYETDYYYTKRMMLRRQIEQQENPWSLAMPPSSSCSSLYASSAYQNCPPFAIRGAPNSSSNASTMTTCMTTRVTTTITRGGASTAPANEGPPDQQPQQQQEGGGFVPEQFENSLGCLTVNDYRRPRQAINLEPGVAQHSSAAAASNSAASNSAASTSSMSSMATAKHRLVLGLIEALYLDLIRIDKLQIVMMKICDSKHRERQKRYKSALLEQLLDSLIEPHHQRHLTPSSNSTTTTSVQFSDFFLVRKGVRLVINTINFFDSFELFQRFFRHFVASFHEFYSHAAFNEQRHAFFRTLCLHLQTLPPDSLEVLFVLCSALPPSSSSSSSATANKSAPPFVEQPLGLAVIFAIIDMWLAKNLAAAPPPQLPDQKTPKNPPFGPTRLDETLRINMCKLASTIIPVLLAELGASSLVQKTLFDLRENALQLLISNYSLPTCVSLFRAPNFSYMQHSVSNYSPEAAATLLEGHFNAQEISAWRAFLDRLSPTHLHIQQTHNAHTAGSPPPPPLPTQIPLAAAPPPASS